MKDMFRVEVQVGDIVAFIPPNYKSLVTGRVLSIKPKTCKIEYQRHEYGAKDRTGTCSRNQVVVATKECYPHLYL